jgi:hypothetical protein
VINRAISADDLSAEETKLQLKRILMPAKKTTKQSRKAPTTQAGKYVHEEIEHVRQGKHGARNPKQAIAIGLSKARKAGIKVPPPPGKRAAKSSSKTKTTARKKTNPKRSRATHRALEREGHQSVSHEALSRQARSSARARGSASRRKAAQKAVRTKGSAGRHRAAAKGARTRANR